MAKIKVEDILAEFKKLSDEETRLIWKKRLKKLDNYWAVPIKDIKEFAKTLGRDHSLAAKLWDSGVRDAKILATFVEEPPRVKEEQIDGWVSEIDYWDLGDCICSNVISRTPFAYSKMHDYVYSRNNWTRRVGFLLLSELAENGAGLENSEFEQFLPVIQKKIQVEDNWVKEAMNAALIAIGSRNIELNKLSLQVARRVGKVIVEYGDDSSQAPDACTKLTSERLLARLN